MATAPTVDIKIDFAAFARAAEQAGLSARKMADAMAKAAASLTAVAGAGLVPRQSDRERTRRLRQQYLDLLEHSARAERIAREETLRTFTLADAPAPPPPPRRGISLDGRF